MLRYSVGRRRACPGGETLMHYDDAANAPFCADPPPCRRRRQGGGSAETTISESAPVVQKPVSAGASPAGMTKKSATPKRASEGRRKCCLACASGYSEHAGHDGPPW